MEVYKRESEEILRRFLARQISDRECIIALDGAVAALTPTLTPEDIRPLRDRVRADMR